MHLVCHVPQNPNYVRLTLHFNPAPRFIAKATTQIYSPLDKDLIREAWVAGDLKEQLGVRHRYRQNTSTQVAEDAALFDGASRSSEHLPGGVVDDYTPVRLTPSNPRIARSDGSLSPPQTEGASQQLLDISAESSMPISPAPSYYSASAIPVSTSGEASARQRTATSPPSTPQRRPSIPSAVVHESRSHPSLGSDGGEYEMRIRSSLPSLSPSGPPPRTPDGTRPGIRERRESYVPSVNNTPVRSGNRVDLLDGHEEDVSQPWSGAIAL